MDLQTIDTAMLQWGMHRFASTHFTPRPLVRSKILNLGHNPTLLSIDFWQTESTFFNY